MNEYDKLTMCMETLGLTASLGSFITDDSASRVQMVSQHRTQALPPRCPSIPPIFQGTEVELSQFVFNVVMPADSIVHSVHRKYVASYSAQRMTPVTTIIFQRQDTGEADYIDVPEYKSQHGTFGYPMIVNPIVKHLREGHPLREGTILAQCPTVHEEGIYGTGVTVETVYLSDPACELDGYVISEELAYQLAPLEMGVSPPIEFGRTSHPRNIYGTLDNFKLHQDIGGYLRDDGLVAALREYDPLYDFIEMTAENLMRIDAVHDKCIYVSGGVTDMQVYDISVESGIGEVRSKTTTPAGMDSQANMYMAAASQYYASLKAAYEDLNKQHGYNLRITPAFQRLITRALADKPRENRCADSSGLIRRTYKGDPLDEYRIEIRYQGRFSVKPGAKIADGHGTKGIIVEIRPTERMPIDECGNRAHAAVFHKACVSRLNGGQFKEHYIAACCRDLAKWVRAVSSTASEDEIWGRLLRFYEIISPRDYSILKTYDASDRKMHIECVISSGIHPTIAAVDTHLDDMPLDKLDEVIIPGGGEVTYIDHRGKTIRVRSRPLIGPKYMYILEKTYDRPMAMSFGTVQHHGLPAGNSRESRNSHPGKQISPRFFAEAENRLYCSMFGSRVVAEALDLANNPDTHRTAIRSILTAENPARIDDLAQRYKNPIGGSRALQLTNHLNACVGPMIVTEEKPKLGE